MTDSFWHSTHVRFALLFSSTFMLIAITAMASVDGVTFHLTKFLWCAYLFLAAKSFGKWGALGGFTVGFAAITLRLLYHESVSNETLASTAFLDLLWLVGAVVLAIRGIGDVSSKASTPTQSSAINNPLTWEYKHTAPSQTSIELKDHAEQHLETATAFMNQLAHPIDTLNNLFLDLQDVQDPAHSDTLAKAKEQFVNIENTFERFREYSQPVKVTRQTMDINTSVIKLAQLLSKTMPEIEIDFQLDDKAVMACVDAGVFEHMLLPLIENAIISSGPGGQVTVSTYQNSNKCCVAVSDTGPGIPESKFQRIFQPFYSTRPAAQGMGLAIVLRSARAVGANLAVSNHPEQNGCTFKLVFNKDKPGARSYAPQLNLVK